MYPANASIGPMYAVFATRYLSRKNIRLTSLDQMTVCRQSNFLPKHRVRKKSLRRQTENLFAGRRDLHEPALHVQREEDIVQVVKQALESIRGYLESCFGRL